MTEPTTYRINKNYHDQTKFRFIENAIAEGLLVPVVPDYDEASRVLAGLTGMWFRAEPIVDAALGAGNGDNE